MIGDIKVIYIILNHSIYGLFFKKEKGMPFNGTRNKINEEKELNEKDLNIIAQNFIGETYLDKDLNELFEFKKREIISLLKVGYSVKERIIKMLLSYDEKIFINFQI